MSVSPGGATPGAREHAVVEPSLRGEPWPRMVTKTLSNGSQIIVVPTRGEGGASPHEPVALELWVMGGTSAERVGEFGMAHLLEHMLFKPYTKASSSSRKSMKEPAASEPALPDLATSIEDLGGDVNAFTSHDETVFHTTVPAGAANAALDALLIPVLHPRLDAAELVREIDVVGEEIRSYDDDPSTRVSQDLHASLFGAHSYGRPVLAGYRDIVQHSSAKLRRFHREVYTGPRLVLVGVGPIDAKSFIKHASKHLAAAPTRGRRVVPKPVREASTPVRVRADAVHETHVALGWWAPPVPTPDACALEVASVVLGYGDSSRLSMQIRRSGGLLTDAGASFYPAREASTLLVTAHLGTKRVDEVLGRLLEQIEHLRRFPIDAQELRRALTVLRSDVVYRRETVQGLAHAIGYNLSLTGGIDGERRYFELLDRVTPETVREVCERWLSPARVAASVLVPKRQFPGRATASLKASLERVLRDGDRSRAKSKRKRSRDGVQCIDLPNGLRIRAAVRSGLPLTAGWLVWAGGQRLEQARDQGASALTASLLTRGCAAFGGDALAQEIEGYAAVLEGFAGRNSMGLHFECLSRDALAVLRRAFECVLEPTFEDEEFDESQRLALEDLTAERDDAGTLAFRRALELLYGNHPFRLRRRGTATTLRRLTPSRLDHLWTTHYPIGRAVLGLCGDFDLDAVETMVRTLTPEGRPPARKPAWPGGAPRYPRRPVRSRMRRSKEQAHIVMAFPGLSMHDSRADALEVLMTILGGQAGRLFAALREKQGLVYHVSASSTEGMDAGHVGLHAATSPNKVQRARLAMLAELERVRQELVSTEELARAKAWLLGQHHVSIQRRSRIASELAYQEAYGLKASELATYPKRIEKIRAADVMAVARDLLDARRSVEVIVSP